MIERSLETRSLLLVYALLLLVCFLGEWMITLSMFQSWIAPHTWKPLSLPAAAVGILVIVSLNLFCFRSFAWGIELERLLRQLLTPLSYFQIFLLSVLSGFAEEWFFRGLLMNYFGLFISSILYALAHFLPSRKLLPWSVLMLIQGLCLGILYRYSGSLLLVAVVHTAINAVTITALNRT